MYIHDKTLKLNSQRIQETILLKEGQLNYMKNDKNKKSFIAALKFKSLTSYFDIFLRSLMQEVKIKNQFIEFAQVKREEKILDFGCGTGNLLFMLAARYPNNELIGVDIDENILKIAHEKLLNKNMIIHLDNYNGTKLPYEDNHFDKVLSSLVIHHISTENKLLIFEELRRVIKPGGKIFILDFAKQKSIYSKTIVQILRKLEPIDDNIKGLIPHILKKAEFHNVMDANYYKTWFGGLTIYHGEK